MEVFILGSGGSMPLPRRHLTSMLLRREGDLFLFDVGEGTQVSLRRLNLRWKKIHSIFISHTHADHVTGIPGILMLSSQADRHEPLYIIGPPRIREYIDYSIKVLEIYLNYEIRIIEIDNPNIPQVVFKGKGYDIRSFPLKHTRTCVGYSFVEHPRPGIFNPQAAEKAGVPRGPLWSKLQDGNDVFLENDRIVYSSEILGKNRPGRKVSFVTDTLLIPSIATEVRNSDLLICEGMFEMALAETAAKKRHMTAQEAGVLARNSQSKATGLIHFSPRYNNTELKKLLDEASNECDAVFLAKDRQVIPIPWPDE